MRERTGRNEDLVIGINSQVHPLNTGHYIPFAQRAFRAGVDFLYYTPIAPNLAAWGLSVNEGNDRQTGEELRALASLDFGPRFRLRTPAIPFINEPGRSHYLTRQEDNAPDCHVSIFSPGLLPSETQRGSTILSPCRAAEIARDPERLYVDGLVYGDLKSVWSRQNHERVRAGIQTGCQTCYLERQYRDLDFMVAGRRNHPKGLLALCFQPPEANPSVRVFQ